MDGVRFLEHIFILAYGDRDKHLFTKETLVSLYVIRHRLWVTHQNGSC